MALKDLPGYKSPVEAKKSVKDTEQKIADLTLSLQSELKKNKDALKVITKHNKDLPGKIYNDKSNPTFLRYKTWLDSPDGSEDDWIIDDGPLREMLGDIDRHRTVYVKDTLSDTLWENHIWDNEGLRETGLEDMLCNAETMEDYEKAFASVPPTLKEDAQEAREELEAIMVDAVQQNVSTFVYDW